MTQGARTAPYAALRELMAARYMSVQQLAARMGVTEKCAERLVEGKNPLTPYAATRLEIALGIPAKVWLEAEAARRAEMKARQL